MPHAITAAAPPLTARLKAVYGFGSAGESIAITATTSFLLIFYNQVRGLSPGAVGIALAAGLVVNAVFDPLIGSWSDRTRSCLGRRHPFMFASILPAALCFYAVFNPPAGLGDTGQLIWLGVANTLLLQAMTLYHTPHLALGGELSGDYLERSSVMSYNTYFLWIGDTLGWLLSFRLFFRPAPGYPNGALDPARWPLFSGVFAVMIAVIFTLSSLATLPRIKWIAQAKADTPRFGVVEFARDIGRALSNRNYVVLLIGLAFQSLMGGVRIGLSLYINTYFWQLSNDQISLFVIASFSGYLFAAFAVTPLHRGIDKRWTGAGALAVYSIGPVIPIILGWAGVISSGTPGLLPLLIAFALLQHIPYSLMTTTIYSVLADIADENELKFGMRQEAILYSTRTFFFRVDQALGTALAGWVLSWIAFPQHALPGHVEAPVLSKLAMAVALSAVPGLIAVIFYARLGVSRQSYDATKAALAARGAMSPPDSTLP